MEDSASLGNCTRENTDQPESPEFFPEKFYGFAENAHTHTPLFFFPFLKLKKGEEVGENVVRTNSPLPLALSFNLLS